jgi:glycosyltransferase involved in cell wall biosynthesis
MIRRVRELEGHAVRTADAVVAVSNDDAKQLSEIGNREDVTIAPHGVDTQRFHPVTPEIRSVRKREFGFEGRRVAIFAGGVHYPNIEAARALRDLAQEFETEDVLFLILGRAADPSESHGNYRALGFVSDVLPYYQAADFALNPLATGSGTSIKMLEFLAMGLPVVATPVGARGFNLRDGREALVRDLVDFPAAIRAVLDDPEFATRLGSEGRAFVEAHHSWTNTARIMLDVYLSLAAPISVDVESRR